MMFDVTFFRDVWGNTREGWDVNDVSRLGPVEMNDENTSRDDVIAALSKVGITFTDASLLDVWSDGDGWDVSIAERPEAGDEAGMPVARLDAVTR